jgi:integrase
LILSFRHETPTAEIDARWVDELKDWLAGLPARNRRAGSEKTLSPASVNKVLALLAQALDLAKDYGILPMNPARGRRRRVSEPRPPRDFLEPDMVVDLLEAAGQWEAELTARHRPEQCYGRRELLALLCLGGPRIGEALAARRGDFDLAGDHWRIPDAKTPAGERTVELSVYCAEELRNHVAASPSRRRTVEAPGPMFPTRIGSALSPNNVRRMIRSVVARADERRTTEGKMLLPAVTPQTLRRTFASLCFFAGRDPAWVMGQMGHADPRLTLAVYAQTEQRRKVDHELVWSLMRFADESERWPGSGQTFGQTAEGTAPEQPLSGRGAKPQPGL